MKNIIIGISLLLLSGCAIKPKYIVSVDSIGKIHKKTKYFLLSGLKDIPTSNLEFQEYSKYIDKALKNRGFVKSDFENADVAIFLRYGISEPQNYTKLYSVPIYGKTSILPRNTYYTARYSIKGYQNKIREYILFTRYYELNAIDLKFYKKTKKNQYIWKMIVTSTGASGELRTIFPVLIAASKRYIGINTGKKVKIKLY